MTDSKPKNRKGPDTYERFKTFLTGAGLPERFIEPLTKLSLAWLGEGTEVAASRFKAYKQIFISLITPDTTIDISVFDGYFKKSRSGNVRLRSQIMQEFLHDYGSKSKNGIKHVRAWLDLVYTILPPPVTTDVYHEWRSFVQSPRVPMQKELWHFLNVVMTDFRYHHGKLDPLVFESQVQPFVKPGICTNKRSPYYSIRDNRMITSLRSNMVCYQWVPLWTTSPKLYNFYASYPELVNQCLLGSNTGQLPPKRPHYADVPIGTIGCIPEQGLKYRWIANPHISVQMVGEPIKRCLAAMSLKVPWVYTFDQDAGRRRISNLQNPLKTIHCFDASKFTDTFSRDFQKMVVHTLASNSKDGVFMSDFLELISSSPWQCSVTEERELISWTSGQPLGTGPSFHAACLSHAMVIYSARVLSLFRTEKDMTLYLTLADEDRFRIFSQIHRMAFSDCTDLSGCVGDDSFIAHDSMASAYDYLMHHLGVRINKSKSINSSHLAEFCGKWIFGNEVLTSSKPVGVYTHYDQLLDEIRKYGPTMLNAIPISEIERFNALQPILRPKELGGIGMLDYTQYTDMSEWNLKIELERKAFDIFVSGILANDVSNLGNTELEFLTNDVSITMLRAKRAELQNHLYTTLSVYYDLNNEFFIEGHIFDTSESLDRVNMFSGMPVTTVTAQAHEPVLPSRKPTFYDLVDLIAHRCCRNQHELFHFIEQHYTYETRCVVEVLIGNPPLRYRSYSLSDQSSNQQLIQELVNDNRRTQKESLKPQYYKAYRTPKASCFRTTAQDYARFADCRSSGSMGTTKRSSQNRNQGVRS